MRKGGGNEGENKRGNIGAGKREPRSRERNRTTKDLRIKKRNGRKRKITFLRE
jgi:hypothetical protein